MKRTIISGILVLVLSLAIVSGTSAADATFGGDFNSAYIWRGMTFNDGLVFQPSIDVSHKGFGINIWGNLDIDDYNDTLNSGEFSEIDMTLSYSFDIQKLSVSLGYIEYVFSAGVEGTREVFVSLGLDIYKGLTAGLNLYYDVDEIDDIYATATLGYSLPIGEKFTLDLQALAGYAGKDFARAYGGTDGGFNEYVFSATGTYTIIENLSVSAYLNYTGAIDDDVLPDVNSGGLQDVDFFGGVGIYYSF